MRLQLNLSGVESRWCDTRVSRLHYYRARGRGEGPPLVLLHGLGAGGTHYRSLMRHLRPHFSEIYAPDAPGHGFSAHPRDGGLTADACYEGLAELLDEVVREPFVLFGNSLGGGAALRYALDRPSRVASLVLISPAGAPLSEDELGEWLRDFELKDAREARAFLERVYFRTPWYTPVMARQLRRLFEGPTVRQLLGSVRPEDQLTPERASSLEPRTLLIWGKADRVAPSKQLDWFRRHLPSHAEVREPETYGHSPYLEAPRAVAEDIIAFVTGGARP